MRLAKSCCAAMQGLCGDRTLLVKHSGSSHRSRQRGSGGLCTQQRLRQQAGPLVQQHVNYEVLARAGSVVESGSLLGLLEKGFNHLGSAVNATSKRRLQHGQTNRARAHFGLRRGSGRHVGCLQGAGGVQNEDASFRNFTYSIISSIRDIFGHWNAM